MSVDKHHRSTVTRHRAEENVEKWGQQTPNTLLAAMAEELTELLEISLPEERPEDIDGTVWSQLRSVEDAGDDVHDSLDWAEGHGYSVEIPEADGFDPEEVREELYDLMALCHQLDWALYQGEYVRPQCECGELKTYIDEPMVSGFRGYLCTNEECSVDA